MDPNANLEEQRKIAERVVNDEGPDWHNDLIRLAELVIALDIWIKNGGCLPSDWEHNKNA